jgi:DNA-binding MarR family transcriptional regulator
MPSKQQPIPTLADSIEAIVVGAVGLTSHALSQAAPDTELTFPQWRALVIVGANDDGVRVGRVAESIGITAPATGRLLRRLEQRGLLTLTTDHDDRRATVARLTGLGAETRAAIVAYRRRALRSLAKGMTPDQREELTRAAAMISDAFARFA